MIPLRTDALLRSTPSANYALIAINVVIHAGQSLGFWKLDEYALSSSAPQLHQFVTYAFLHGGWMHLIGNMVFLYTFGNNVSDKLGQLGYVAFYLAGGIAAGLGHVLTSGASVVGASGAVAAVTGAYMVLFPRSKVTVLVIFVIIGVYEVPGLLFVLAFFLKDVFLGLLGGATEVAHSAHVSGSVFGIVVSLGMLAGGLLPRDQFDLYALMKRWNRRREYRSAVRTGWDPYARTPGKVAEKTEPTDPQTEAILGTRAQVSEALAHRDVAAAATHYLRLMQMDGRQVLSRTAQLDVASQLAAEERWAEAATAYEGFLRTYPTDAAAATVMVWLGMMYGRYLGRPDLATRRLEDAIVKLHSGKEAEMARAELARLTAGRGVGG